MSLTLALKTALSGIQANQSALQVTSNNIANVNTVGFTRKSAEFEARRLDLTGAGVNIADISRSVDEFLLRQVQEQQGSVAALSARERFLSQIQGIFGTPSSDDTIASGLTTLNNDFETLALTPESESARFEVVNNARKLTVQLNQLSDSLQTLRAEADQSISSATAEITNQLQFISTLNARIAEAQARGQPTGELRDQRDLALARVNELVDIRTFESGSGKISIFTSSGQTLLSEGSALTVSHTAAAQTDASIAYVQPGDANYPGPIAGIFAGTPDLVNGTNDITTSIRDGELKGLIDARDTLLPNLQKEIDRLTAVLKTQINTFHNQGTAFPPPATLTGTQTIAATDAFSGTGSVRVAVLNQTSGAVVEFVDINLAGLGATATVNDVVNAINAGLTGTPASINATGNLVLQAQTVGQGISIGENTGAVTVVGGETRGLSHYFGLNDFFQANVRGSDYNSFATARQASSTTALGLAGTLTFRFDGTAGVTVNYAVGDSLEAIAASINGTAGLTAQNITATVSDDSGGRRLTITDNFSITDSSTLLSTTNMTVDETSFAGAVTVVSAVADNSDLVARGQLNLTAAVGATGVSVGDGNIANSMAGVFGTDISIVGSGGLSTVTTTVIRYAGQIVDLQASLAGDARTELEFNEAFLETIVFRQQSDSGVNIDEELAGLIVLENAFAASSRVLSAVSQMLDDLLNSVR
ncbi:MAG: flagellar hook-associated protein FlgK [Alphaproteobacteria bacterium]|nr:flagellar hook-associated protein FlgK [Alphaproteobacteria bacterium]